MRKERKGEYFLIHKRAIARDSWTGGGYTQYIADRDDGSRQPCRISMLPWLPAILGFILVELVSCGVFLTPLLIANAHPIINWAYVHKVTFVGFMLFGLGLALLLGNYRLMKAVQWRSYDGERHWYTEPQPRRWAPIFDDLLEGRDEVGQ